MLLQDIIELIAPAACLGCNTQGDLICWQCAESLPMVAGRCYFCNGVSADGTTCTTCLVHAPLARVSVAANYDGLTRELILKLKFERSRSAAQALARLLVRTLPAGARFDVVTAIPIAPRRYRERGYNQSELMARALAQYLSLPYRHLLSRTDNHHQIGRTRAERLRDIQGVFYPTRSLGAQHILIVDDVLTTGATLAEAARILTDAGAGTIEAAVIAHRR